MEKKEKRGETVVKSGSGRNTYIYISNETNERDRERKRERKIGNRTDLDRNHFIFARDDDASATRPRETRTMIRGEAGTKGWWFDLKFPISQVEEREKERERGLG